MKNNQAPKDLVKLTSEPPVVSNEYFLILVCKRQIFRCELKMSFETDPENRNIARPVCDLVKTALPLPDEEYTTAECLPARLLAAATANGSILLYNIATSTLISRLEVPGGGSILTLLPTTLHLIAVREMKDEPNQLYLYELNDENSTIRFAAETPAKVYNFKKGKIRDVFFNQAFEHMFTLCEDGSFWDLPIKAEKREEIDDEDADKKVAKPVQTINADPELLGFFHCSKVIFCDEIKDTNKVVSVSVNGLVLIHNMDNGKLVANMKFNAVFTAADIGRMGNILVLATNAGVLRAIDLSDLKSPRLIYCRKLHKSKSIRVARLSGDQKYIAVVFEESSKVYFLSGLPSEQFQLYGYTTILQGTVLDGCWSGPTITPQSFTSVSKNGLLVTISFNEQVPPVRVFKEIPHDLVTVKSRKIDYDITLVAVEHDGGDVYCTGEEKTVRRYKQPEELIQDMDSRARAPFAPIDEVDGQDLGTTYFRVKAGTSLLVSGGNEGTCIIRSTNVPTEMQTINCQNNMNGGVSACSISESRKLLIAGGNDGSLLVFKYGTVDQGKDSQNRLEGVTAEQDTSNAAEVVSEPDSSLQFYEVVLEQQTRAEREGERNALHQDLKNQLRSIQEELNSLLQANEQADPIQKIERDEFCLDLEMKDQMLRDGDQEVERIKKNAYNLNLQEELLHKKINQTTYSKLDNHLKTITGLSDPILIFNFVTRKKEKMENDRYRMISNLRQVELTEKKWRKENKMDDIIDLPSLIGLPEQYKEYIDMNNKAEMDMRRDTRTKAIGGDPEDKARRRNMPEDHTDERVKRADLHSPTHHDRKKRLIDPVLNNPQRDREIDEERKRMEADQQAFLQNYPDAKAIIYKPENFICNLQSAKQRMLLLDHAKREEERLKTKAAAMDYDKKTDNQDTTIDAPDRPPATGYRLHRMSRNPRGRKKQGGAQMKDDDADENQTDSSDQEAEVDDEGKQDWDNMYGAFELFTTKRKRSQVMFLKNIIFKIKKSFNREFEAFFKNRTKQIEWINEQNILIQELLGRLEKVEENFKPALNIIENPRLVLELEEKEVTFEKYLTKKERRELEEKRLKEEQFQKNLSKDDAGFRALKQMMNNTLEEKKENIISNDPVEEEWMKKPDEELKDEEKVKKQEFQLRKKKHEEEVMKLKKKLEQDLKKLRDKINEVCTNFDQKLFVLFTKRLEYQYRIYEQEGYIVKLLSSINAERQYGLQLRGDAERLSIKNTEIEDNSTYLAALENTKSSLETELNRRKEAISRLIKFGKVDLSIHFDKFTKDLENERKALQECTDEMINRFRERHPEVERRVVETDIFNEIENDIIKKQAIYEPEQYKPAIDEAEHNSLKKTEAKDNQTFFDKFNTAVESRIKNKKDEASIKAINEVIKRAQEEESRLREDILRIEEDKQRHSLDEYAEKNNIFIEIRLLNRMVEIPNIHSYHTIEGTVLTELYLINRLNEEICTRGKFKVQNLEKAIKDESHVKQIEFQVQQRQLEIEDLILESMAITRLKVTRKLQAALSEEKENEKEEKNLEDQIKTLKKTRDKRIEDMELKRRAMKKEIEAIRLQNDTLTAEGAKLQDTVLQRKKILHMMESKTGAPIEENMDSDHKSPDDKNKGKDSKNDNQAYKKAMQIAYNRRLFDQAKKLAQEFELLMQELKKLKARTFAQIPAAPNNFI